MYLAAITLWICTHPGRDVWLCVDILGLSTRFSTGLSTPCGLWRFVGQEGTYRGTRGRVLGVKELGS